MGLTWILALITNWQRFAFLQFPSTILNSLQGNMLNDLRQRMSKTILFQLLLWLSYRTWKKATDSFSFSINGRLYCGEMDDQTRDVLRKS